MLSHLLDELRDSAGLEPLSEGMKELPEHDPSIVADAYNKVLSLDFGLLKPEMEMVALIRWLKQMPNTPWQTQMLAKAEAAYGHLLSAGGALVSIKDALKANEAKSKAKAKGPGYSKRRQFGHG